MSHKILITGGAGFIGNHVVRHFVRRYPQYEIYNLDALTYAGNLENLADVEDAPNYHFIHMDLRDMARVVELFEAHRFDGVIHLAAESHVDRSIEDPLAFVHTNVLGTVHLLYAARKVWGDDYEGKRFYQVSTDEVYGSLGETGYFTEETPYAPRSPYSASKASADHFVRAYHHTYGMPVLISNCSNNYGPYQFPEKLIPLVINNILHRREIPVYGDGSNVRDWLWVLDHVDAIDRIYHHGMPGETYNIGGNAEMKNIELVQLLCDLMDQRLGRKAGESRSLIRFVKDRPGHDKRYAIDISKIKRELGWQPRTPIDEGLRRTIDWYLDNAEWLQRVTSGEYREYYERHYAHR